MSKLYCTQFQEIKVDSPCVASDKQVRGFAMFFFTDHGKLPSTSF